MPSTIRYLYYMMTMDEFKKRFPNEIITEVRNFKDNIPDAYYKSKLDSLTQEDEQTRYLTIDLLIKILPKIKKIEGYSNEQIERYIENALAIMFQERFKDGFKEKNSDIIYKY